MKKCFNRDWHFHESKGDGIYVCYNCGHTIRFFPSELNPNKEEGAE